MLCQGVARHRLGVIGIHAEFTLEDRAANAGDKERVSVVLDDRGEALLVDRV